MAKRKEARDWRELVQLSREYRFGNCYVASEALYHLLGGKHAGWKPMRMRCTWFKVEAGIQKAEKHCTHWFIKHLSGMIIDPSVRQFRAKGWWVKPDYSLARGSGFLTKKPSARARRLMRRLTWSMDPL